jgi:hypothetical protein
MLLVKAEAAAVAPVLSKIRSLLEKFLVLIMIVRS